MKLRIAVMLTLAQLHSLAQANEIVADRPGFSTGTHTVVPGKYHLEAGFQRTYHNGDTNNQATNTMPLLNVRMGATPDIEVGVMWDGWNIDENKHSSSTTSGSDITLAGKYRLYQSEYFNLTALGLLSLPVGKLPSSSETVDPLLGLLWDYNISETVGLFGVVQSQYYKSNDRRTFDVQLAVGASFTHSEQVATFIEIYAILPTQAYQDNEYAIDGGITYLVNADLQLDINVGFGLQHDSDNFIGFGIAQRF